jgi:hypothetical protein
MKKVILFATFFILISLLVPITSTVPLYQKSILQNQKNSFLTMPIAPISLSKNYPKYIHPHTKDFQFNLDDGYDFSPQDIVLKDDAFHRADTPHFIEWWYFDAAFNNGYSAQMSVRVVSAINQGIVFSRLDIYKEQTLISHNKKIYILKDFYASTEVPFVQLEGKDVIRGYIDNSTGDWVYDLSFGDAHISIDLQFIGSTKGWKGQLHGGDWWAVIFPKADVSGTLKINNNIIELEGIGYHDHNWEVTIFAGINFGWFWGKIHSKSYSMIWANILTTFFINRPILVINKKDGGYQNINPEAIEFTASNFIFHDGLIIPSYFTLTAYDDDVLLQIGMEVLGIHHDRIMGFANYWRYHVHCTGSITIGNDYETIDTIQMAEFIRFR